MVIRKLICQAPTFLDDLIKVVSPHEMSPCKIKNVKQNLETKSLLNHFKYDSGVLNTCIFRLSTLLLCEMSPHELSSHGHL